MNKSSIEAITYKEPWDALVNKCELRDFYYFYDYHRINIVKSEFPVLVHYRSNDSGILLPMIVNEIPGTNFKDASSIWGYGGPLIYGNLAKLDLSDYNKCLTEFLLKENIVTVFCRLHPYLEGDQSKILKGMGVIEKVGINVNIDLQRSPEDQLSDYSSRHRTYINKARRSYRIKKAESLDDLQLFIDLYYQTMNRLKAARRYYFDRNYFLGLWESQSFKTTILLAEEPGNGQIICGAMFIWCSSFIQYHHSGTDERYIKLHPVRLLIDEMRQIGTQEGMKYFNLGGGLGGRVDSLFEFKAKFSKDFHDFNIWKYVINPKAYYSISQLDLNEQEFEDFYEKGAFFPKYRANMNHRTG